MTKRLSTLFIVLGLLLSLATLAVAADPSDLPGVASTTQQLGETNPGSVLIFNLYTSGALAAEHNTSFFITNVNRAEAAIVHIFFVNGDTCAVADSYLCLTPNQTVRFLASDVDPGVTGYLLAVATDANGCPVKNNYLIGSEYVKLRSGHQAKLPALAIPALRHIPCRVNSSEAGLHFNDREYGRLPRVLALDQVLTTVEGNNTMLFLNSVGGNVTTGITPAGTLFGVLFDDAESAFAFRAAMRCQLRRTLSDDFPVTTPVFTQAIRRGNSGWLRLQTVEPRAITGAAINFHPDSQADPYAFNGGANLHVLRYNDSTTLMIPVFPAAC